MTHKPARTDYADAKRMEIDCYDALHAWCAELQERVEKLERKSVHAALPSMQQRQEEID